MNNAFQIAGLALVALGAILIILGAYISLQDWRQKHEGRIRAARNALDDTLTGLTKLLDALKDYPLGQQMIVWGIVIIVIGGVMGGVSGLK